MAVRAMIFIDGENIVFRYQDMVRKGAVPKPEVVHVPDVLVWHPETTNLVANFHILRATYYTYATGDDERVANLRTQIRLLGFQHHVMPTVTSGLVPMVFKKPKQAAKAKGVDIQMTVDVLTHVHQNNTDVVYLVTGDGDYEPLIQEVLRSGKQVHLAAFSDGLNPNLRNLADGFQSLDQVYFSSVPSGK